MSTEPPRRRRKLLTCLKLAVLLTTIAVGGSVAYQAANPNAGMLNCPVNHFKIGILCIDRDCGLFFLFELLALAAFYALMSLVCDLLHWPTEDGLRQCRWLIELLTYLIMLLLLAIFIVSCVTWP